MQKKCVLIAIYNPNTGKESITDTRCVWLFSPTRNSHKEEDTTSPTQIMSHTDQRIKLWIIDNPLQLHTLSKWHWFPQHKRQNKKWRKIKKNHQEKIFSGKKWTNQCTFREVLLKQRTIIFETFQRFSLLQVLTKEKRIWTLGGRRTQSN